MAFDDILDVLVNLGHLSSDKKEKKKDAPFKSFIAPALLFAVVVFLIKESQYLVKLLNPVLFYIIFSVAGLVLAVLLTYLFLVTRILTQLNWGVVTVMIFISFGLSIASGSYINRIKSPDMEQHQQKETLWFDYAD